MKRIIFFQIMIFFISNCAIAQSSFYDAIWLKDHLSKNTLTAEKSFNKIEDSLKKVDKDLLTLISSFRSAAKMDSVTKYIQIQKDNNSRLIIVQSAKDDSLFTVLKKYFPEIQTDMSSSDITKIIQQNPFFKAISYQGFSRDGNTPIKDLGSSNILQSIGGLDVTNIADGFAKFIVKRTKQELTITFFEKFKTLISKPEYVDLQTVFPETYQALIIIGDEIYNYQAYIQTLRESFEKDLSSLTANLPAIVDNHPRFFNFHKELAAILKSGCFIAGELRDKVHPGDILNDYPTDFLDSLNSNFKGAIQTLQIISASLRDSSTKEDSVYWVSTKQIKLLVKDPVAFRIYLGLIYQQAGVFDIDSLGNHIPVKFNGAITLQGILTAIESNVNPLGDFISKFGDKSNKLTVLIRNYKKASSDSLALQQYYNYFTASIDLLQQCSKLTSIPVFKNILKTDLEKDMADYFDVARSASNMVLDISKRNYSSAIVNAVHIYDVVRVKHDPQNSISSKRISSKEVAKQVNSVNKVLSKINNSSITIDSVRMNKLQSLVDTLIISNTPDFKVKIDSLLKDFNSTATAIAIGTLDSLKEILSSLSDSTKNQDANDVKNSLFKYGSFMAAIVQAQNSDEVENAIEAIALPSGSARIKRESPVNVSINAYCGLFAGNEIIKKVDKDNPFGQFNSYGITAPIGIAISWGGKNASPFSKRLGHKYNWSHSIFISLVDLGAITAYRFTDDKTAQVPTIQLKDIFSPGIFWSIGIPRTPISVNLGTQVGPNLRKVTIDANDYSGKTYIRYSISFCVDLPLLNLYTKSK